MEICCCPEQCVQNTLLWLAIKVFGHREVCSWKMDDLKQEMKKIDRTLKREDDEIRKIQNSAYLTAVIKLKMINPVTCGNTISGKIISARSHSVAVLKTAPQKMHIHTKA